MTGPADQGVVGRARAGDDQAWRELYDLVGGRLVTWLRAQPHLDAALDADDIANSAWLTAAAKIADFKGTTDDFVGWLFGIARNHTLNANRRSLRRATSPTRLDSAELTSDAVDPGNQLTDQIDWIRRLLAQLPTREAEVVACLDVVGLDIKATSSTLGIAATSVRVAHHRAIKRLRSLLSVESSPTADTLEASRNNMPIIVGSWLQGNSSGIRVAPAGWKPKRG